MATYWKPEVDGWILAFCAETDERRRNEIFRDHIQPAVVPMINFFIRSFRFREDVDNIRDECLSNFYEVLPKFDPARNKKSYSYFNVIVRNWFLGRVRDRKKRLRQYAESHLGIDHDRVKNDPSILVSSHEDEIVDREFMLSLYRNMETWRTLLKKKQEIQVLNAIVFLLQNPDLISIYNKKAVFLYIKEMTNLTSKQVNHHITRIKQLYDEFRDRFHDGRSDDGGTEEGQEDGPGEGD